MFPLMTTLAFPLSNELDGILAVPLNSISEKSLISTCWKADGRFVISLEDTSNYTTKNSEGKGWIREEHSLYKYSVVRPPN